MPTQLEMDKTVKALEAQLRAAQTRIEELRTRDFGMHRDEHEGVVLEARYIVPGKTLHDLMGIFEEAKKKGNEFSGNPSKWPDVMGVTAVIDAVFAALSTPLE